MATGVIHGQALPTRGMIVAELDEMGEFAKFAEIPQELQDKIWKEYVGAGVGRRDVHVNIVLKPLFKKFLWFKIKSKSKKAVKVDENNLKQNNALSVVYSSHSAPPPAAYSINSQTRTLAFQLLPHKPVIPFPINSISGSNNNNITKYIPIDFVSGDTFTISIPFASETFLAFLAFGLSPGFTKYVRPPPELVPESWGKGFTIGGSMEDMGDRRVLKGAGILVKKRNWLKGGRKEGKSVLMFKMCEMGEGLDVSAEDVFGSSDKAKGWKVVERLRGLPIHAWDGMWLRLMEKLELEGADISDDGLVLNE